MSVGDFFLLVTRWLHLLAAAAWVGGGIFYLLVLRPASQRVRPEPEFMSAASAEFRTLVNTSVVVLIATGVILATNRLTSGVTDTPYAVTLGAKSILSIWMFLLVQSQRRHSEFLASFKYPDKVTGKLARLGNALSNHEMLVALGLLIFFLSDLLGDLFEIALAAG